MMELTVFMEREFKIQAIVQRSLDNGTCQQIKKGDKANE